MRRETTACSFSHDLKTLPQHFGKFIERNISPGVIIIRQEVAIRDAALWLQFFHEVGTLEDFINAAYKLVQRLVYCRLSLGSGA